jgi:hypothetical protein
MVMKPTPPTWMSANITPWPRGEKKVPVSTTASQVTQTAEVAVKTASTKDNLPHCRPQEVRAEPRPRR